MEYEVSRWVFDNPAAKNSYFYLDEVSDSIKQAIINDIRKNGYLFSWDSFVSPVLNTGEMVRLDYDLCEELMCKAYGFDDKTFIDYVDKARNEPSYLEIDEFKCDFNCKIIIWVKDDEFLNLKESIMNGNYNVEIIPSRQVKIKKGDVVVFKSENESDSFEVQVKAYLPSIVTMISHFKGLKITRTKNILSFVSVFKYEGDEELLYRNENLSGKEIYNDFKNKYDIWASFFIDEEFDCLVDAIVFDKNVNFNPVILDSPSEIKLDSEVFKVIEDKYNEYLKEQEDEKKKREEKYLKLKEKVNAKKAKEEEEKAKLEEENINPDKIPFVTMDNLSDYFNNEEDSVEDLISKATKEYNLALSNNVHEKKIMLLNNACIYFDKINKNGSIVPSNLFYDVKLELLKLYITGKDIDHILTIVEDASTYFASLDDDEKDNSSLKFCNLLLQYIFYLRDINDLEQLVTSINLAYGLLKDNDCDDALFIKSNILFILSSINFEAEMYDEAIDYGYNAMMLTKNIVNKTPDIYNQYASFVFSLGNIYFQSDMYDNAITLFKYNIDFCKENEFKDRILLLNYSLNYLSQVYVCKKQYDDAINGYLDYISYSNENFSGDEASKVVIDFLYRIGVIYHKFLNDDVNAKVYIDKANEVISSLDDKNSDDVKKLIDRVNSLL